MRRQLFRIASILWISFTISGCTKRSLSPPGAQGVLVIAQASKEILLVDWGSLKVTHFSQTGDAANHLIPPPESPSGMLTVINSGGFAGVPSIEFVSVEDGSFYEVPLPSYMNPMRGVWIGKSLYFTDFGKTYSENVYVFDGERVVDSIRVGPRPIGIVAFDGFLFIACTGMDSLYQYGPGLLFRLDMTEGRRDSLIVNPGASELALSSPGDLLLLTTGGMEEKSVLYLVDAYGFQLKDSLSLEEPVFTLAASDSVAWVGSWGGNLYSFLLPSLESSGVQNLGGPLNSLLWEDLTSSLWVTIGGYSGGPNYLLRKRGESQEQITISETDVGVGNMALMKGVNQ